MNRQDPFELPLMVRGYELDAFNHVNHAVYAQYFEHCRWMALRELGDNWQGNDGVGVVVRKLTIEYEASARLFDELQVRLWVEKVGTSSVTFGQDLLRLRDDKRLARAEVVAVCIDARGRPRPLPEVWAEHFNCDT